MSIVITSCIPTIACLLLHVYRYCILHICSCMSILIASCISTIACLLLRVYRYCMPPLPLQVNAYHISTIACVLLHVYTYCISVDTMHVYNSMPIVPIPWSTSVDYRIRTRQFSVFRLFASSGAQRRRALAAAWGQKPLLPTRATRVTSAGGSLSLVTPTDNARSNLKIQN